MSDKDDIIEVTHTGGTSESEQGNSLELPKGWLYYRPKFGSWTAPYYASPPIQLLLVSLTFFLCPGMYNALSGLGGGGQLDATVANNATVALYSTFATVAFFSGAICNRLGVKVTLALGGFGYVVYIASFISYNHTRNAGFVIGAGAILGISAALLWAAETVVMISYPHENSKGKYIAVFWTIFNMGAVIGALVPLIQNLHSTAGSVGDGTYIAFLILTALGTVLAFALCNADKVVRADGSKIILMKHPTWQSEFLGLWEVLKSDTYIVLLFPMFLASNWFYTYQFNDFNLARFNVRTRALNSLIYWSAQIVGSMGAGILLDIERFQRPTRARAGLLILFVITMGLWGGGYSWQKTYTRESADLEQRLDWTSPGYAGPLVLYLFYGAFDAIWQTYIYWTLGAISNNSRRLTILAGFYKSIQSAGAAIIYRIDALKLPYMNIFASTWGLLAGGLIIGAPVVWMKVTNHTDAIEDVKFSDEAVEDLRLEILA